MGQTDEEIVRMTGGQQTDRERDKYTDRHTFRGQKDKQMDRTKKSIDRGQAVVSDRQTDLNIGGHTDTQRDRQRK